MPSEQHIMDFFEDRARKGDGAYAIAFALLQLSKAQENTAYSLNRLGFGDAATSMGAIELFGMKVAETGDAVASAIESVASSIAGD